jgi:hypothetical protein
MAKLQWILGNAKLQKTSGGEFGRVVGFGIPADTDIEIDGRNFNTCPGALACRGVCYAKQGAYLWASTVAARKRSLDQTLTDTFAADAIADLQAMRGVGVVRIHDSGDFYSQKYLDAWCDIARALPSIIFYAYTKSLHLNFNGAPTNLRITQSLGGKFDNLVQLGKPHSRIFSTDEARVAAGYVDGNESDAPAIKGLVQIGLVYHGNKKLTDAQSRFFGA